jgi:hypothetical protein
VSTDTNKISVFPGVLFRRPFPGQSFDCCRFPIRELLPLAAHGFEQFWILKRIAKNKIFLVYSCGWEFATRTCGSTTSTWSAHATNPTQTDPSMTSASQIVVKSISGRSWMGDWSWIRNGAGNGLWWWSGSSTTDTSSFREKLTSTKMRSCR